MVVKKWECGCEWREQKREDPEPPSSADRRKPCEPTVGPSRTKAFTTTISRPCTLKSTRTASTRSGIPSFTHNYLPDTRRMGRTRPPRYVRIGQMPCPASSLSVASCPTGPRGRQVAVPLGRPMRPRPSPPALDGTHLRLRPHPSRTGVRGDLVLARTGPGARTRVRDSPHLRTVELSSDLHHAVQRLHQYLDQGQTGSRRLAPARGGKISRPASRVPGRVSSPRRGDPRSGQDRTQRGSTHAG